MNVKAWLTLSCTLAFSATFFASPTSAMPTDFSKLYVFGDSLSDIGNVYNLSGGLAPPSTRYYGLGRFSNGPVWIDTVANSLGIDPSKFVSSTSPQANAANFAVNYSINFAYGGAGTGVSNNIPDGTIQVKGLLGQVADFTALATGGVSDPEHSLYSVWIGSNDYLLASSPLTGLPNPPNPVAIVANVREGLQELYDLGARNFLVPRIPDLGKAAIVASLSDPAMQLYFTSVSRQHNALLGQALLDLMSIDPGITFYSPDIFGLYGEIAANPAAFGFTHSVLEMGPAWGCLILPPFDCTALGTGLDSDGYATWDEEHPTTALHTLIAQRALAADAVVPEPATWTLFLIGIFCMAIGRRKVS